MELIQGIRPLEGWQLSVIRWLNRPAGRNSWKVIIGVAAAMLGALEEFPSALFIAAIVLFLLNGTIEHGLYRLEVQLRRTHVDRVREAGQYLLATTHYLLNTRENFQSAVMILHDQEWRPQIRHRLQLGKHRIYLGRNTWTAYAEQGRTVIFPMTQEIKQLVSSDEDIECFRDVTMGLVTPIYMPNSNENLIAVKRQNGPLKKSKGG